MQKSITVAVEGPGASRALDEFLAIAGIVGEARPAEPLDPTRVTRDAGMLTAVGEIVGMVGGVASIVSAIIDWREKLREGRGRHPSVVIQDTRGNRISLENATPEQITAVLQTLRA